MKPLSFITLNSNTDKYGEPPINTSFVVFGSKSKALIVECQAVCGGVILLKWFEHIMSSFPFKIQTFPRQFVFEQNK